MLWLVIYPKQSLLWLVLYHTQPLLWLVLSPTQTMLWLFYLLHNLGSDWLYLIYNLCSDRFFILHNLCCDWFCIIHNLSSDLFYILHNLCSDWFLYPTKPLLWLALYPKSSLLIGWILQVGYSAASALLWDWDADWLWGHRRHRRALRHANRRQKVSSTHVNFVNFILQKLKKCLDLSKNLIFFYIFFFCGC